MFYNKFKIYNRVVVKEESCPEHYNVDPYTDISYEGQHGIIIRIRYSFDNGCEYYVRFDNPVLTSTYFREEQLVSEDEIEEVVLHYVKVPENQIVIDFDNKLKAHDLVPLKKLSNNLGCGLNYDIHISDKLKAHDLVPLKEEIKMNKSKFKLGDKVLFLNIAYEEYSRSLSSVYMITGVEYDSARGGWIYEVARERFDGTTISFSNISQCYLAPYTDYTSRYIARDAKTTYELFKRRVLSPLPPYKPSPEIKIEKAIFNPPYTIVIFSDKSKSIVKCGDGDTYDPEKGLALAICKKGLGTNKSGSNYYDIFKKFLPKENVSESHKRAMKNKEVEEKNPCVKCPKKTAGCFRNCETLQEYTNNVSMDVKARAKTSKEIKEERRAKDLKKGFIQDVYQGKYKPTMFPSDFIKFCNKNNLVFYLDDKENTMIDPSNPKFSWQKLTAYLKANLVPCVLKEKYIANQNMKGKKECVAVDVNYVIFSKKGGED